MSAPVRPGANRLPDAPAPATATALPAPAAVRSPRHDGFSPERQRVFVEALADTASVREAARAAGISPTTAYRRRAEPDALAFRRAWTAALAFAFDRLTDTAFDRAVNGVEEPVFHGGEIVGTRTRHNDRLLMFLLRRRGEFIPVRTRYVDGAVLEREMYDARSFARMLDRVGPAMPAATAGGRGDGWGGSGGAVVSTSSLSRGDGASGGALADAPAERGA